MKNAVDFSLAHRNGLFLRPQKARHLGRILDQVIRLVRHIHLDQNVARKELALGVNLLAAAHFDHILCRHEHFFKGVFQALRFGLFLYGLRHLLLKIGIGVDDVPMCCHCKLSLGRALTAEPK